MRPSTPNSTPSTTPTPTTRADVSDLHTDASSILTTWSPPDDDQARLRDAYLEHLHTYPDAMWRACRSGHLTSSAIIVDPIGQRVLLTLHPGVGQPGVGRWLQTGGHCEPIDPSLGAAALREAREESGIPDVQIVGDPLRLDRHEVGCRAETGERTRLDHLDVQWLAIAPTGAVPVRSAESADLRWWPWDALPTGAAGADRSVHDLITAARIRLGH